MKTLKRTLAMILSLLTLASMFFVIPAFADDASNSPNSSDIRGASSKLVAPHRGTWLDAYETGYIYGPKYGEAANKHYSSSTTKRYGYSEQGTEVTLLAYENGRYLVKTYSGEAFWVDASCISDHYVAPGRKRTGDAEVDAYGPNLNDMRGANSKVDKPTSDNWLDEYETRYVYAPKHNKCAYMYYYVRKPKDKDAKIDDKMGKIDQGTEITLLAHENGRYLVRSEYGDIFWLSDSCTSTTFIPYGRVY